MPSEPVEELTDPDSTCIRYCLDLFSDARRGAAEAFLREQGYLVDPMQRLAARASESTLGLGKHRPRIQRGTRLVVGAEAERVVQAALAGNLPIWAGFGCGRGCVDWRWAQTRALGQRSLSASSLGACEGGGAWGGVDDSLCSEHGLALAAIVECEVRS